MINDLPVKHVSVTVVGGSIVCTPDPVEVKTHNALVTFNLDTAGYNFPDTNAIVVTTPNSQFPYASWTIKPQLAGILDVCNDAATYKYSVTVVETATGATITVDPLIKNGGIGIGSGIGP